MTPGDWALLVGLLLNAAAVAYAARLIRKTHDEIKLVHKETNDMRAKLEAAQYARGKLAGQEEKRQR